jgi:hypothetical protein
MNRTFFFNNKEKKVKKVMKVMKGGNTDTDNKEEIKRDIELNQSVF